MTLRDTRSDHLDPGSDVARSDTAAVLASNAATARFRESLGHHAVRICLVVPLCFAMLSAVALHNNYKGILIEWRGFGAMHRPWFRQSWICSANGRC